MATDGKTVTVEQYTRKLPATRIPVGGGTVDFDKRFAPQAKCGPFKAQYIVVSPASLVGGGFSSARAADLRKTSLQVHTTAQ